VLAALLNAATLLVVSVYIFWEAFRRIGDPPHVDSGPMLAVAIAGLAANAASARVLSRGGGHQHDLNTRGAFLHVVGDLLGSVGAIGAAVTIRRRAGIWPIQSSRAASACSSSGARGDCFGKRWACRWNQRPCASTSRRCTAS
jgi:cation diffusion facilitator family transporter